jgi:nitrite reductase (NADH) large subunit
MYLNQIILKNDPIQLIMPSAAEGSAVAGIGDLPDSAQICSCEAVTKATLCSAIDDGASSVADLKSCTKAGTGCGGCVPMMTDLFKQKMRDSGVAVSDRDVSGRPGNWN